MPEQWFNVPSETATDPTNGGTDERPIPAVREKEVARSGFALGSSPRMIVKCIGDQAVLDEIGNISQVTTISSAAAQQFMDDKITGPSRNRGRVGESDNTDTSDGDSGRDIDSMFGRPNEP